MSLIEDFIENTNESSNPYYAANSGNFFTESLGLEPVMVCLLILFFLLASKTF